jgi:hypothetical protein
VAYYAEARGQSWKANDTLQQKTAESERPAGIGADVGHAEHICLLPALPLETNVSMLGHCRGKPSLPIAIIWQLCSYCEIQHGAKTLAKGSRRTNWEDHREGS